MIANMIAALIYALLILFLFIEKVLCQNDWSPIGPESNPIVVVKPKVRNKSQLFKDIVK